MPDLATETQVKNMFDNAQTKIRNMFDSAKKTSDITKYMRISTDYYRHSDKTYPDDVVESLFAELKETYPYSGIDDYFRHIQEQGGVRRRWYGYNDDEKIAGLRYLKLYTVSPYIEQVVKAGIVRVFGGMIVGRSMPDNMFDLVRRNFKKGKTLKEITGLPSYVLSSEFIRKIDSIAEWNEFRVIVNKYANTKENFDALMSMRNVRYSDWGPFIRKMKRILNSGYYTLPNLISYLDRLDIYQAIGTNDAIDILTDYLSMCKQCNAEPRLDSNSLKREHDVMMRNFWSMRQDVDNAKFDIAVDKLKRFEHEDGNYMIIAPKSAQDIINEGVEQRNCVGSYVRSVANGSSIVLFMRDKRNPDRSLVTIDVDPSDCHVRQKRLACNAPITNQRMLDFIDKWERKIMSENKGWNKEEEVA